MMISMQKYLTDGSPRVISLSATKKIYFNHTSEVKMFAFCEHWERTTLTNRREDAGCVISCVKFLWRIT